MSICETADRFLTLVINRFKTEQPGRELTRDEKDNIWFVFTASLAGVNPKQKLKNSANLLNSEGDQMSVSEFIKVLDAKMPLWVVYGPKGDFCEREDGEWTGNVPDNLFDRIVIGAAIEPRIVNNTLIIYTEE